MQPALFLWGFLPFHTRLKIGLGDVVSELMKCSERWWYKACYRFVAFQTNFQSMLWNWHYFQFWQTTDFGGWLKNRQRWQSGLLFIGVIFSLSHRYFLSIGVCLTSRFRQNMLQLQLLPPFLSQESTTCYACIVFHKSQRNGGLLQVHVYNLFARLSWPVSPSVVLF